MEQYRHELTKDQSPCVERGSLRARLLASPPKNGTRSPWELEAIGFLSRSKGRPLLAATDATFRTPGKIALWTKADSITRFEHLEIRTLP